MTPKALSRYDKYKDIKVVTIVFDEDSTHIDVINQFINGLTYNKFAPKKEIIWHLENIKVLIK